MTNPRFPSPPLWVLCSTTGRLGNRLFLHAHALAAARENAAPLWNLGLGDYAAHFAEMGEQEVPMRCPPGVDLEAHPGAQLLRRLFTETYGGTARGQAGSRLQASSGEGTPRSQWLAFGASLAFTLAQAKASGQPGLPGVESLCFEENDSTPFHQRPAFVQALANQPEVILIDGWEVRAPLAATRQGDFLRPRFSLRADHAERVAQVIAARRTLPLGHKLVGVHVRQTDYAQFQGGRFFFPPAVYLEVMRRFAAALAPTPVAFLVVSDADLTPLRALAATHASTPQLGPILAGSGDMFEDLYALSHCDYLVGPPSTYSMWASFMGRVPYLELSSPEAWTPLKELHWVGDGSDLPGGKLL